MKYRNLKLSFTIEHTQITIRSICLERLTKAIPKHSHSKNSYELHYVSYGYGTLIVNEQEYPISPGTLFMTGPEISHEQISSPTDPMTEYCIYLQINTKKLPHPDSLMDTFLNCGFWIGPAQSCIHELMKQIFVELETRTAGYELMLQSLLQQVILQTTRHYKEEKGSAHSHALAPLSLSDLSYLMIEEAFLYDYRNLTLDTLAEQLNLGTRQTERLLQKHYGKTFLQKRTEARMSAACLALTNSTHSISYIAEELGYSSSEHFTNAFKRYYNITPSSFRASASV